MRKLQEQITGNTAMVFHGSKEEEVYKYLCEGKWESHGVYGAGLYTVYDLSGTQTEGGGYGNYIMKLYIRDLSNYWCFTWSTFQKVHPIWAKHTNEDDFIDYQAEKFNLIKYGYPKNLGNLYFQYKSYPEFLKTVDGIIYHGKHDGDCILHYNPYNCRPIAISSDFGKTWKKIDEKYVQQYKQILSNPDVNKNFYNDIVTNLIIPDTVTEIEDYAFEEAENLKSVTISNSVIKIGDFAFQGCCNLNHITISNSVTYIGESAFGDCSELTNVIIPDSVTYIGESAFYNCENLTSVTIPNSVTKIRSKTFCCCESLTSITIPNSVTEIGRFAFKYCTSLTSIVIPNSVISIKEGAFANCTNLTSITISNSVTEIEGYVFYNCTSLTNINIPNSVTSIDKEIFYNCPNLTEINYEGTKYEWNKIAKDIDWHGIVNFNA